MLNILVSNDDGVYAPGIRALSDSLRTIAEVMVVAPDRNRSGASNSLTLNSPLYLKHIKPDVISVEGTPTDCVHVAVTGLLKKLPDMVVSGINAGSNMGDDVWYSGTVAAAMEGRFLGLPAMAISLTGEKHEHYDTAARVVLDMVKHLQAETLPASTILNINVPDIPYEAVEGYEVTRLGTRHCAEPTIKQLDPRGNPIYWVGPAGKEEDAGPGTDFHAIRHKCVSITPLRIDITHYESFDRLSGWVSGLQKSIDA